MNVAILSIPAQEHRIWALMGHYTTLGFPVIHSGRIIVYQGFDYTDYPTRRDALEAMVADGHEKYRPYLETNISDITLDSHADMCEWGLLNIMRKVIETDTPTLVLENDAYFPKIPTADVRDSFGFLVDKWWELASQVGQENINVAMLTVIRPDLDKLKTNAALEDVDDFWTKGACGPGQTANIYTPQGARFILEKKPPYPNIEAWIYYGDTEETAYGNIPNIYSTREGLTSLHFFSNFDSPHTHNNVQETNLDFVKGVQL